MNMNINNLVSLIRNPSVKDFIPLKKIKNEEDKKSFSEYNITYTEEEFIKIFPKVNIENIYFKKGISNIVYFDLSKYIYIEFTIQELQLRIQKNQTLEECLLSIIDKKYTLVKEKNFSLLFISIPDSISLLFLRELIRNNYKNVYELFKKTYFCIDYGFNLFSIEDYKKLFKFKTSNQKKETQVQIESFPEIVTIYRGQGDKSTNYLNAVSWTLDINIAYFFAIKNTNKSPKILIATVSKKDIFEYSENEKEVLVFPEHVNLYKEIDLYGLDDMDNIFSIPFIQKLFFSSKYFLNEVYNIYVNNITQLNNYDRIHSLRVLFLSLLIGFKLNCSEYELNTLAHAAIFHDIGRVNDLTDISHGLKGYEYYKDYVQKENILMKFILEYHSKDDESAKKFLKKSDIKDKENVYKLLSILKDADALDRIRFGKEGLNINLLRNNVSKKMVFIAFNVFKYLKI